MKTIAEAVQEFVKRNPDGIPVVVIPAGDALIVDVNTVAVWTDRVAVPVVVGINVALALVFGGLVIKTEDDDE